MNRNKRTNTRPTFYEKEHPWLKKRGYRHLLGNNLTKAFLAAYVSDRLRVKTHAFLPLLYTELKERRYRFNGVSGKRTHHIFNAEGQRINNSKIRPIHFACHLDAAIYSYYSSILNDFYENYLKSNTTLSCSILAYRKIPIPDTDKNKGSINFAKDVFEEISHLTSANSKIAVLALDIKDFFNGLDYSILKSQWCKIIKENVLPEDHYAVYKACTQFRYIFLRDIKRFENSRKKGFNEKRLNEIRSEFGNSSFFGNPQLLRYAIREKHIKVYKDPFKGRGIPQGLPISSILSNIYMLSFDEAVVNYGAKLNFFSYKRYSDDMIFMCPIEQLAELEKFLNFYIAKIKLKINHTKTERFLFIKKETEIIECFAIDENGANEKRSNGLKYLGFEFNGQRILIKSSNVSKFYRKGIESVKIKAKHALAFAEKNQTKPVIFINILKRQFNEVPDRGRIKKINKIRFKKRIDGSFEQIVVSSTKLVKSNYLTYVKRASEIMQSPEILHQLKKHNKIFHESLYRYFYSKKRN